MFSLPRFLIVNHTAAITMTRIIAITIRTLMIIPAIAPPDNPSSSSSSPPAPALSLSAVSK